MTQLSRCGFYEDHDLSGNVDLCEVTGDDSNHGNIKNFIRKILAEGNYVNKNPMHFDTIGFESVMQYIIVWHQHNTHIAKITLSLLNASTNDSLKLFCTNVYRIIRIKNC